MTTTDRWLPEMLGDVPADSATPQHTPAVVDAHEDEVARQFRP